MEYHYIYASQKYQVNIRNQEMISRAPERTRHDTMIKWFLHDTCIAVIAERHPCGHNDPVVRRIESNLKGVKELVDL